MWVYLAYGTDEAWTQDDLSTVAEEGVWRRLANLDGIENVVGSAFADVLIGDVNSNRLQFSARKHTLVWSGGFDVLDGGADTDTADFSGSGSAVWVYLAYDGKMCPPVVASDRLCSVLGMPEYFNSTNLSAPYALSDGDVTTSHFARTFLQLFIG